MHTPAPAGALLATEDNKPSKCLQHLARLWQHFRCENCVLFSICENGIAYFALKINISQRHLFCFVSHFLREDIFRYGNAFFAVKKCICRSKVAGPGGIQRAARGLRSAPRRMRASTPARPPAEPLQRRRFFELEKKGGKTTFKNVPILGIEGLPCPK